MAISPEEHFPIAVSTKGNTNRKVVEARKDSRRLHSGVRGPYRNQARVRARSLRRMHRSPG